MRRLLAPVSIAAVFSAACATAPNTAAPPSPPGSPHFDWGIVVHGGAGAHGRASSADSVRAAIEAGLETALRAGHAVLARGGNALDAVEAAVVVMEDNPQFNAGKGAVFTRDGTVELDASIVDGSTKRAGAVGAVSRIKNPIRAARALLERPEQVFLVGEGAHQFARENRIEFVDNSYFRTDHRWRELQDTLQKLRGAGDNGTVGAVALDQSGRLAVATSTGGRNFKRSGRVGDTPIIGAGSYASPLCASSGTGNGEFFIRHTITSYVCSRVERGESVEAASTTVVGEMRAIGGDAGVITLDSRGNFAWPFNTRAMSRGYMGPDGRPVVAIFR